LIDAEILGAIKILKRRSAPSKLIPEFEKGLAKDFEIRPICACYVPTINMAFFGFHDGNIMNLRFNASNPEQNQIKSEPILAETVLFLIPINNDVIIVSTTSVKIINEDLTVIGGGSLRKRLGTETLVAAQFDAKSQALFLGTTNGHIYIYDFKLEDKTYKLSFIDDVIAKKEKTIEALLYKKGNLFCAQGLDVSVWNYKTTPKPILTNTALFSCTEEMKNIWSGNQISSMEYHSENKILMTGLTNGLIVFWSAKYGDVVSIITAHFNKIIKLIFLEEKDLLYSCGISGEIRLWKCGEVPKEMIDEIKTLQLEF